MPGLAAGLLAVVFGAGCPWLPPSGSGVLTLPPQSNTPAIDPAEERRLAEALESPSKDVRRQALRAIGSASHGELPPQVAALREDGDAQVRAAALETLTRRHHPEALKYLTDALQDVDLGVRVAAIGALGELGQPEAGTVLSGLLKEQPEAIRAATAGALARREAWPEVARAVGDTSWRVRLVVAEAMAQYPRGDRADLVGRLLEDPSTEVQLRAVAAIGPWPLEEAGPLLLSAMSRSSYLVRKRAAEQLAGRWPPAKEFPRDGKPERRAEVLQRLQDRFHQEFPRIANISPTTAKPSDGVGGIAPDTVWAPLLDRLTAKDVFERRGAAEDLARMAAKQPLPAPAVARLAQVVTVEPDQAVWRSVLQAVAADGSEPSLRLAYAAISHPVPEVRRRACEHLGAHPQPEHAKILEPTLQDPSHDVVCAAIRALAATGRLPSAEPLRRLLASTNEEIRLETAVALMRLRDPAGTAALERLSYSGDPKIRLRAAEFMGEMPDPSFVSALIRLVDDRGDVSRAALASLPKVVGRDVAAENQSPADTADRIRRWKQWYQPRER